MYIYPIREKLLEDECMMDGKNKTISMVLRLLAQKYTNKKLDVCSIVKLST